MTTSNNDTRNKTIVAPGTQTVETAHPNVTAPLVGTVAAGSAVTTVNHGDPFKVSRVVREATADRGRILAFTGGETLTTAAALLKIESRNPDTKSWKPGDILLVLRPDRAETDQAEMLDQIDAMRPDEWERFIAEAKSRPWEADADIFAGVALVTARSRAGTAEEARQSLIDSTFPNEERRPQNEAEREFAERNQKRLGGPIETGGWITDPDTLAILRCYRALSPLKKRVYREMIEALAAALSAGEEIDLTHPLWNIPARIEAAKLTEPTE